MKMFYKKIIKFIKNGKEIWINNLFTFASLFIIYYLLFKPYIKNAMTLLTGVEDLEVYLTKYYFNSSLN